MELVKDYLKDLPSERPLKLKSLERYLLLTNDIPGVVAKSVLRPSANEVGAADLVVTVERHPFNASLSADNYGSSYTGEWDGSQSEREFFHSIRRELTFSGLLSEPFDLGSDNEKVVQLLGSIHPWSNGFYIKMMGSYTDKRRRGRPRDSRPGGRRYHAHGCCAEG